MHGYVGNPNNDPQTTQVLDDSDNWTAAIVNTPTQAIADSVAAVRSKVWLASENWPSGMQVWNGTALPAGLTLSGVPPVWDAGFGRWIAFAVAASGGPSTGAYMLESEDGRNWRATTGNIGGSAGSNTNGVVGLFMRPTDGAMLRMTVQVGGLGSNVTELIANNGSTLAANIGALFPTLSAGNWWSGGYMTSLGLFVVWPGGATSGGITNPHWSDGVTTWAPATTWSPPTGFVFHNLAHLIINASGSALAVIFPAGTAVVASCMISLDGKVWGAIAMPTFTLSGEQVIDAGYDSFTGTIYLLSGNGTNANLWSTPVAGIGTWTLVKAFSVPCYALRANGREVLVWVKLGNSYNGSALVAAYRALVSINPAATPGASIWYSVGLTATTNAPGTYFALRANGSQFMYVNTNEFAASLAAPLGAAAGV